MSPEAKPATRAHGWRAGGQADKTVVIFRKDLLPLSETFIRDQVGSYARWRSRLLGFRLVEGIDVVDLMPVLATRRTGLLGSLYLKLLQHGQYFGLKSRGLRDLIRNCNAKLVHAHFGYDAVLLSDVVTGMNLPLCVTLHGTDVLTTAAAWQSGRNGRFFKRYPAKLARLFRDERVHFICVSHALRQAALDKGAPAARTHVFYTGIDLTRFPVVQRKRSPTRVLFVGRLVAFKGCDVLIRAMATVCERHPDATLVVVGDGPQRRMLQELAAELAVPADFLGALPASRVAEEMGKAGLFCLPSVTDEDGNFEAFGMVLLEAQACGLPVVTSARAGAEAIRSGQTGFIFPERDTAALAAQIDGLIADEERFTRMGHAARAHVENAFDIRACTAKLESFYDTLLKPDVNETSRVGEI